ncbi:ADP-ribosylglycohydrolase family protein [Streptomyces sp. NBC_01506]|uniref:ADP-ribosylglycohydrolase family protein n=1 Tax=Streptomyces sp. NBC_01506 TaxID=2903887 RepID=UPI003870D137
MHAALNYQQLLRAELAQRQESGYDVAAIEARISADGGIAALAQDRARSLLTELESTTARPGWTFFEPESLAEIISEADWPAPDHAAPGADYEAKAARAWNGRIAGNMLGKPVESLGEWSPPVLRSFLESQDAWPLTDYFPAVADTGEDFPEYVPCWTETTRGRISGSARDDDLDYTILNLHILRTVGPDFSTADVAAAWLTLLPFLQTFTAERVAIRNLVAGVDPEDAANVRNPYREYIGAAIRADVFGYVSPGDAAGAAELAYRDAVLSHRANGVYGEMWCAALVASAFTANGIREAFDRSLTVVPHRSRLHAALSSVREWRDRGLSWEEARARIDSELGFYGSVHTVVNAAVLAAGLLWADGDFDRSIALTVLGGLDTDSNGATAGSVAGLLAPSIDERWTAPLEDTVRSAVFGYDGISISSLVAHTVEVATALREKSVSAVAAEAYTPRDIW